MHVTYFLAIKTCKNVELKLLDALLLNDRNFKASVNESKSLKIFAVHVFVRRSKAYQTLIRCNSFYAIKSMILRPR